MKSNLAVSITVLSLVIFPLAVGALTQDQINQQIQSLILQATALQQKIVTAAINNPTTVSVPSSAATPLAVATSSAVSNSTSSCPKITSTLALGSQGAAVSALQNFLAQDVNIYPSGKVSGYFGLLTQQAVQQFQLKYKLVTLSDATTTGYGIVGPHTRALILSQCGNSGSTFTIRKTGCALATSPTTTCSTGWQPVTSSTGCTTSFTCSIAANPPIACPTIALSCKVGFHDALSTSSGSCTHTCVADSVSTDSTSGQQIIANPILAATPPSGNAPFTVLFSGISSVANYTLDFGDATPVVTSICSKDCAVNVYVHQTHTYIKPGTYTAILKSSSTSGAVQSTASTSTVVVVI